MGPLLPPLPLSDSAQESARGSRDTACPGLGNRPQQRLLTWGLVPSSSKIYEDGKSRVRCHSVRRGGWGGKQLSWLCYTCFVSPSHRGASTTTSYTMDIVVTSKAGDFAEKHSAEVEKPLQYTMSTNPTETSPTSVAPSFVCLCPPPLPPPQLTGAIALLSSPASTWPPHSSDWTRSRSLRRRHVTASLSRYSGSGSQNVLSTPMRSTNTPSKTVYLICRIC